MKSSMEAGAGLGDIQRSISCSQITWPPPSPSLRPRFPSCTQVHPSLVLTSVLLGVSDCCGEGTLPLGSLSLQEMAQDSGQGGVWRSSRYLLQGAGSCGEVARCAEGRDVCGDI